VYDDVTYVYDDVTYVYDDVTYQAWRAVAIWSALKRRDDVTYVYDDVTYVHDDVTYRHGGRWQSGRRSSAGGSRASTNLYTAVSSAAFLPGFFQKKKLEKTLVVLYWCACFEFMCS